MELYTKVFLQIANKLLSDVTIHSPEKKKNGSKTLVTIDHPQLKKIALIAFFFDQSLR